MMSVRVREGEVYDSSPPVRRSYLTLGNSLLPDAFLEADFASGQAGSGVFIPDEMG